MLAEFAAATRSRVMAFLGVTLPRVPGHEIGGVIDAVGEGVVVWKVGQRVGVGWQGGIARRAISAELAILLTAPTLRWSGFRMMAAMPNIWSCRNSPWLAFRMSCLFRRGRSVDVRRHHHFQRATPLRLLDRVKLSRSTASGGLGHLAVQFAAKMGFRTVAINRNRDKEALSRRLGADDYVDSVAHNVGEALSKMGGATAIISTAGVAAQQTELIQGLRPNGRLVLIAAEHGTALQVSGESLQFGRRGIAGWYSGHAKDSEETMAFAVLKGRSPDGRNTSVRGGQALFSI